MGLLTAGKPLSWEATKNLADHVRRHGVLQFINLYNKQKNRNNDVLKFGDEIEYMLVKVDHEKKTVKTSMRAQELLNTIQRIQKQMTKSKYKTPKNLWKPEYASFQIEGIPGVPFGGLLAYLNIVESNMRQRREEIVPLLRPDELLITMTTFPRLGCPNTWDPPFAPNPTGGILRSMFVPDEAVYQGHPRFSTFTRNFLRRTEDQCQANIPIFRDIKTPSPFRDDFSDLGDDGQAEEAAKDDHVYMDCLIFSSSQCCIQLTFQTRNLFEARVLYDQLVPLCPIMLALSASAPIHRGYLTDVDCRWDIFSQLIDDRTPEERELNLLTRSRWSSVDYYISPEGDKFNDIPPVYDEDMYKMMVDAKVDSQIAKHIAKLFIKDVLILYEENVNQDDEVENDHFENINSSIWQSLRFKPPPPNGEVGWRIEFRVMDIQFTDLENAAFVAFLVLLTRTILSYQLNLLIPISKVEENMNRAHTRDALLKQKFWFCRDIFPSTSWPANAENRDQTMEQNEVLMTVNEIINGKKGVFPGLIPVMNSYLRSMDIDVDTHFTIQKYLRLIQNRAAGETMTNAQWIRNFVRSHPDYKFDSVVSERITYDLIMEVNELSQGRKSCPELHGYCNHSHTKDEVSMATIRSEHFNGEITGK